MSDEVKLEVIANKIADRIQGRVAARPKLRLIRREDLTDKPSGLDPQSRDCIYRRIRDLARMYWLSWLVRQETVCVGGVLECLEDDKLVALLSLMEQARERREEGLGFEGIVRNTHENIWGA